MEPIAVTLTYVAMICALLAWASWLLRRGTPSTASHWPSPRNYALVAALGVVAVIALALLSDTHLLRILPSTALWTVLLMIPIHWISTAVRMHSDRSEQRREPITRP